METFGEATEVFTIDYFTAEVVDDNTGFASFANIDFHGGTVNSRVGIEANAVVADGRDGGDVKIDIGSYNLVGVVGDIGAVHEDTTAIGAKINGFAPFGAGEDIELLADTVMINVFNHGEVAGYLIHRGNGDTAEIAVFGPTGSVDAIGFEDTVLSTGKNGTSGVFNKCTVNRHGSGDRDVSDTVIFGRGVAYIYHVGTGFAITVEGKDNTIHARTLVNNDGRDAAREEAAGVGSHQSVNVSDTIADFVVGSITNGGDILAVVDIVQATDTDNIGLVAVGIFNNNKGAVTVL